MSQPLPVKLDGGLDLEVGKHEAPQGTLAECLNYERNLRKGYSRIDGFERYDGIPEVSSVRYWRLESSSVTGTLSNGMAVYFTGGQVGYILTSSTSDGVTTIDVVFQKAHTVPTLPATLTGTGGASAVVQSLTVIATPGGTCGTLDTALAALATTQRAQVGAVPGRVGSDPLHVFWLKNRCYAIRDLCTVPFTGGYYTDVDEGHYVTIGASEYEILDVAITGEESGVLTIDCTAGSGDNAGPTGSPDLDSMALSGDYVDGSVGTAYSDGITLTGGVAPVVWSIVDGLLPDPDIRPDPDSPSYSGQQTNAALYKATATGWERVDLGREMAFSGGTSSITNFDRSLTLDSATLKDSGAKFPTDSLLNGVATTTINADDGTLGALTGASGDVFIAKGFDFSGIPSTAVIKGIEVVVERRSDTANQARDQLVDLVGLSGSVNKARGTAWPNTIATTTYGGSSDMWGTQGVSLADLQSADFGVRVMAFRVNPATAAIGGIDYITCKVYYVERETPAYVWNGTSDVSINIRHIQILTGDQSTNTAEGWITLTAAQNGDKTRLIDVGDEIRTAASGAGDLLGVVASRDKPIWLPGQTDLENNGSKYRTLCTNFYYQDEYDAAYTVQGCGPCWYYDGTRAIRIRVPLGDSEDAPRHVERHGTRLALGYYPGTLILSSASDPFEMRGERGAQPFSMGDRMTVLSALSGDALAIGGEARIETLRGFTSDTFFQQALTAQRGLIEYTDADAGKVLAVDTLGILQIDSPEALGSASSMYLSERVDSWLRPRLQADDDDQTRPCLALAVREKSQYRLYFWDGWIVTLTMDQQPYITTQRYTDENDVPLVVRSVCSGIDKDGRERLFACFYGKEYVYELDVGRSFDGEAIPAYITINPVALGVQQQARLDHAFVFGTGGGVATLAVSRASDYYSIDTTVSVTMTLGDSTDPATIKQVPLRGGFDLPVSFYDVAVRFDSTTATEAPHTLQLLQLMLDGYAPSRGHLRDR